MLKPWMVAVGFLTGIGLLIFLTIAPFVGLEGTPSPIVLSGLGIILGFFFAKQSGRKREDDDENDG